MFLSKVKSRARNMDRDGGGRKENVMRYTKGIRMKEGEINYYVFLEKMD